MMRSTRTRNFASMAFDGTALAIAAAANERVHGPLFKLRCSRTSTGVAAMRRWSAIADGVNATHAPARTSMIVRASDT